MSSFRSSPSVVLMITPLVVMVTMIAVGYATARGGSDKKEKRQNENEEQDDSKAAERIIQRRRSIFPKDYDPDRKVPKEMIEKMLYNANYAPTHGRTRPWRFIVFSGASLEALGEFEAELYKKRAGEKFRMEKYEKKKHSKKVSSFVIAICMSRQESEMIDEMEEIEAVACAVQNMHLVASANGIAAYWSSGDLVYSPEMKEYLGLSKPKDKCLGMFYVGYSRKPPPPQEIRNDILEKVIWRN